VSRRRSFRLAGAALAAVLVLGCESLRDAVDGAYAPRAAPVPTLQAPAGPAASDLDLHHEWRAAHVRQQVAERHRDWAFRPFTELVVLNGVAHRSVLLLPSQHGEVSTASFKIAVPAEADAELVAFVALFPKFAPDSDGVEAGWGVGDGAQDPATVALQFERLAGGKAPDDWREVRIDLAPWRGRTIWIVLASRDPGHRHSDWVLWGDPRVRAKRPGAPVVVDLAASAPFVRRPRAVPWSAATVFKTYSVFSAKGAHYGDPGWLRAAFPWLTSLRFLSALGGNHGPTLAREDAAKAAAAKEPPSFETGVAERYEFFRDDGAASGPIAPRLAWAEFDALNASAVASGLDPIFNLAGAPERFTGGTGHYPTYRFNELAIVDEAGWREYVRTLFAHLAAEPWFGRATFSFFSEPNCVWVEADGRVRKIGFQGDAAAYARQYLATWQAMAPVVGAARVHLGPFVVETERSSAAADNLGAYLRAIVDAFAAAREPLPPWHAFAFNLYETPHMTLDHFADDKIGHARRVLADALGRGDLPIAIEELGIHPIVSQAFQDATTVQLGTTHWEMAWHAEMAAVLLEQHVEQAASWYPILMLYPPKQSLRAYTAYLFASIVAGAVEWSAAADGTLALARAADAPTPSELGVRLATRHTDRVGVLVGGDPTRTHRLAVWSYPRSRATDARVATGAAPEQVEIRLPARAAGAWRVRILGYEDDVPLAADAPATRRDLVLPSFPGLPRIALRELAATDRLTLTLAPGTLYLVELY
jgi:hypothetical protein